MNNILLNSAKSPCFQCEDRHFKCHSTCEKYLKFRKEADDNNMKKVEFAEKNKEAYEYYRSVVRRHVRSKGGRA